MEEYYFPQRQYEDLLILCRNGDIEGLHIFLKDISEGEVRHFGPQTLCPNNSEVSSPLNEAIICGRLHVVEYFLESFSHIIDINKGSAVTVPLPDTLTKSNFGLKTTYKDVPPLVVACITNVLEIVQYLVSKGADLNKQAPFWGGPLHVAAQYGSVSIINYLLDCGVDVNVTNYRGYTPLLMVCGFNVPSKQPEHTTKRQRKICRRLAAINNDGRRDLDYKPNIVKLLLSKGADIYSKTIEGFTVMHEVARCGRLDIINLLLEHNMTVLFLIADPTNRDYVPCPLYLAAANKHKKVVDFFCDFDNCPDKCKVEAYLLLASSTHYFGLWNKALTLREQLRVESQPMHLIDIDLVAEISSKEELFSVWDSEEFHNTGYIFQLISIQAHYLGWRCSNLCQFILQTAEKSDDKVAEHLLKIVSKIYVDKVCHYHTTIQYDLSKKLVELYTGDLLSKLSSLDKNSTVFQEFAEFSIVLFKNVLSIIDEYRLQKILSIFSIWINKYTNEKDVQVEKLPSEFHRIGKQLVSQILLYQHNTAMRLFIHEYFRYELFKCVLFWGFDEAIDCPDFENGGRRPLHVAAIQTWHFITERVIPLLLFHGAHVDAVDASGKTALDYCSNDVRSLLLSTGPPSLSCYAARTIVSEKIPYKSIDLPIHIVKLIELHDSETITHTK